MTDFVTAAFGLIPIAAFAGFSALTIKPNLRQGISATITDWLVALAGAAISLFMLLFMSGMSTQWFGILIGLVYGYLGVRPLIRVWASPVIIDKPFAMLDKRVVLGVLGGVAVTQFLGLALFTGYIAIAVLLAWNAFVSVRYGSVMEQRIGRVASSLSAVIGLAEERIYDSAPFVDDDGTIVLNRIHSSTVARLDRLDQLVAQMMPEYEVTEANAARIVLSPVSARTAQERANLQTSGGLISNTGAPVHPSLGGGAVMEEW